MVKSFSHRRVFVEFFILVAVFVGFFFTLQNITVGLFFQSTNKSVVSRRVTQKKCLCSRCDQKPRRRVQRATTSSAQGERTLR